MCEKCGCGDGGEVRIHSHNQGHAHDHDHGDGHPHSHEHSHPHPHPHDHLGDSLAQRRSIDVHQSVLAKNERLAERNRGFFKAKKLLVINVVSSPGAGKTSFLSRTITDLGAKVRMGVIVGDLATDNDARRLQACGAPVVQITTGTLCHLDAEMVAQAAEKLNLDQLDLLIIENVGNLVCPAAYDLGEDLRVALFSVTEGEDKPLKYPPVFSRADAVVINKMDIAEAVGFQKDVALSSLRHVCPRAILFEVSARTGQGMAAWYDFLQRQLPSK